MEEIPQEIIIAARNYIEATDDENFVDTLNEALKEMWCIHDCVTRMYIIQMALFQARNVQ